MLSCGGNAWVGDAEPFIDQPLLLQERFEFLVELLCLLDQLLGSSLHFNIEHPFGDVRPLPQAAAIADCPRDQAKDGAGAASGAGRTTDNG